jgi:hypothetical protein
MDFSDMIEYLREILRLLERAQNFSGSITYTSPIEPLIEVALELVLKLAQIVRDGEFKLLLPPNPEVIFREDLSDPLGNPLSIQRKEEISNFIFGPLPATAKVLKDIVDYLANLKQYLISSIPSHEELREIDDKLHLDYTVRQSKMHENLRLEILKLNSQNRARKRNFHHAHRRASMRGRHKPQKNQ